jgi:hypothetical protein
MVPTLISTQAERLTFPEAAALAEELCLRILRWPHMLMLRGIAHSAIKTGRIPATTYRRFANEPFATLIAVKRPSEMI